MLSVPGLPGPWSQKQDPRGGGSCQVVASPLLPRPSLQRSRGAQDQGRRRCQPGLQVILEASLGPKLAPTEG